MVHFAKLHSYLKFVCLHQIQIDDALNILFSNYNQKPYFKINKAFIIIMITILYCTDVYYNYQLQKYYTKICTSLKYYFLRQI